MKNPVCACAGLLADAMKKDVQRYLGKGTGSWSIGIPNHTGTMRIQNTHSGDWKTNSGTFPGLTDLTLKHESGDDSVFHLIEVERE